MTELQEGIPSDASIEDNVAPEEVVTARAESIEPFGVDIIPPADRYASPSHPLAMLIGSSSGFAAIVLGWLPIAYGLGWWSSFSSIMVGAALGSAVLAPCVLLGPKTHTNIAVLS